MKKLHSMFVKTAVKNALIASLGIIAIVFVGRLFSISQEDRIVLEHGYFLIMFIVYYFSHAPLGRNILWMKSLPIKRSELIKFNISFNAIKLVLGACIWLVLCSFQMYRSYSLDGENIIGQVVSIFHWETFVKLMMLFKESVVGLNVNSEIFSSMFITIIMIVITFYSWLLLSVKVRQNGPQTNQIDEKTNKLDYKLFDNDQRRLILMVAMGIFALYLFTSNNFSMALGVSVVFGFLIAGKLDTYQHYFSLKLTRLKIGTAKYYAIPMLVLFIAMKSYSYYRITHKDIKVSQKMDEIEFHRSFYGHVFNKELKTMMEGELSFKNIDFLMQIYGQKHGVEDYKFGNYEKVIYIHKVPGLDFKKTISSKTTAKDIQYSLGLFKISELSFDEVLFLYDHMTSVLSKEKNYSRSDVVYKSFKNLNEVLSYRDFNREELVALITSHDSYQQKLGLHMNWRFAKNVKLKGRDYFIKRKKYLTPKYDLTEAIFDNILKYNTANMVHAHRLVNALKCSSNSMVDTLKMRIENKEIGKAYKCQSRRSISSLREPEISTEGYIYLNNSHFEKPIKLKPFEEYTESENE